MMSATITESVQLLVDGPTLYMLNTWNLIKVASIGFFWSGLLSSFLPGVTIAGHPMPEMTSLFYGVCLFFMWLRILHLLSVHKSLGPLVVVIKRMANDIFTFSAVWGILLLAFSTVMQGSTIHLKHEQVDCNSDNLQLRCWSSWWIVRSYFQSFGQPFFEEMGTDGENWITIVMWPVMNMMLINLLIAMMNDTYTEVKDKSKLQWMVEMFHIAKENRSPSRINAILLVYDLLMFTWTKDEVDARMKTLVGKSGSGSWRWVTETRFKFKKYQMRDLPNIELKEVQKELQHDIAECEALQATQIKIAWTKAMVHPMIAGQQDRVAKASRMLKSLGGFKIKKSYSALKSHLYKSLVGTLVFLVMPHRWIMKMGEFFGVGNKSLSQPIDDEDLQHVTAWQIKLKRKLLRLNNRQKLDSEALRDQRKFFSRVKDQFMEVFCQDTPVLQTAKFKKDAKKSGEDDDKMSRVSSIASKASALGATGG